GPRGECCGGGEAFRGGAGNGLDRGHPLGLRGSLGGVPAGKNPRLLPRGSDLHPPEDPQRDRSGEGSLDLREAGGGPGQQAQGQGRRRGS
ncbi:unnamed protein product, partial [Ectocarpus fasciculatus]